MLPHPLGSRVVGALTIVDHAHSPEAAHQMLRCWLSKFCPGDFSDHKLTLSAGRHSPEVPAGDNASGTNSQLVKTGATSHTLGTWLSGEEFWRQFCTVKYSPAASWCTLTLACISLPVPLPQTAVPAWKLDVLPPFQRCANQDGGSPYGSLPSSLTQVIVLGSAVEETSARICE